MNYHLPYRAHAYDPELRPRSGESGKRPLFMSATVPTNILVTATATSVRSQRRNARKEPSVFSNPVRPKVSKFAAGKACAAFYINGFVSTTITGPPQIMNLHQGEFAAVITAVSWAGAAMVFQATLLRTSNMVVNFSKVAVAAFGLIPLALLFRGTCLPLDVPFANWGWLTLSALLGFVVCDYLMFEAFRDCGARTALIIMSAAPILAALGGVVMMGETLSGIAVTGIAVTILGIIIATAGRRKLHQAAAGKRSRGVGLAVLASFFQAAGFLLSKQGLQGCDSLAATQIRVLGALAGFALILVFSGQTNAMFNAWNNRQTARLLLAGGILGPLLGMGLSLYAFAHAPVGIVSTIISTPPVLMIPLAIKLHGEKIGFAETAGAALTITGIAMLFLI